MDLTANLKEINTPYRAVALRAGRMALGWLTQGVVFYTNEGEMLATLTFKV
jgi:hypothetical protein